MLEPEKNPNPSLMVDPPAWFRWAVRWQLDAVSNVRRVNKRREKAEARRQKQGAPHQVHYFHQLDDPYSHLTAQVLAGFASKYEVVVTPHLIRASGGRNQPELEKLAKWARRDAQLIAPHLGLSFPEEAGTVPDANALDLATGILACLSPEDFLAHLKPVSEAMWAGDMARLQGLGLEPTSAAKAADALDAGSKELAKLGHYSGAMFFYGGEWYWGVDRLFHLEDRLQALNVSHDAGAGHLVPRPAIDVAGVDASGLTLDFYPSLNSPYTSIIYDLTIDLKNTCGIQFNHKPVLPMIMRGVPATRAKGTYIVFDTKREADFLGVPFGPMVTPIGAPTRRLYSLLPWAMEQGKDEALLSAGLKQAFSAGIGLHTDKKMRRAVEAAGLDWAHASKIIGNDDWKPMIEKFQDEMVEGLGLWGVPSYRLSGPDGEPDMAVWGQDRLWLVAAEIRRRAAL
ncbi:MAG: DsbA family protein [Candidatus Phaeomarinobacter sp.]